MAKKTGNLVYYTFKVDIFSLISCLFSAYCYVLVLSPSGSSLTHDNVMTT